LTEFEMGQIIASKNDGKSVSEIARLVKRSRDCVRRFLGSPDAYGSNFTAHRPSKLSSREKRRVFREASGGIWSARKIVEATGLNVSTWTIARLLKSLDIFKYVPMNKAPSMTLEHEKARRLWAEKMVDYGVQNWNKMVFSDEKKWNLDGPDGLRYYWHDLRTEKKTFFSRQNGGGSVMVWAAFWSDGTTKIAFLDGKQKAADYVWTLSEYLLPAVHLRFGTEFVFQQDNASILTSNETTEFFVEHSIDKIDWPAKSPDLNPIENVWAYLTRKVYHDGKQFSTINELKESILREWSALQVSYLQKLVDSMKTRCLKVLQSNGKAIKY